MEDRKVLGIILGLGICVLIVLAVGFFWFLPDEKEAAYASAGTDSNPAQAAAYDPVEWVRGNEAVPKLRSSGEEPDEFVVVVDEPIYGVPEATKPEELSAETKPIDQLIKVDVNITTNEGKTVADSAAITETPAAVKRVTLPAAPVKTAPAKAAPVKKAPVFVTEYWIQAGSFASQQKAVDVKAKLAEMGTVSRITTVTVAGTNYYRVRLGPYGNKAEAEKFLRWLKEIDSFKESYISEVYREN